MEKKRFRSWSSFQIGIVIFSLIFYFVLVYYVVFGNFLLESITYSQLLFLRIIIIPLTIFLLIFTFLGYKEYLILEDGLKIYYGLNFSPRIIFTFGDMSRMGFIRNKILFKEIIKVSEGVRRKRVLCSRLVLKNGKKVYLPMSDGKKLRELNNIIRGKIS